MLALRCAGFVMKKTTKPTLYMATALSLLWVGVDMLDGAKARFHQRVGEAKSEVVEPVENVMANVTELATKLWASIESNPGPSILALALFAFTIIYHKVKGRTTVDALKMTLLKDNPTEPVNPVLERVRKEAIESQMLDMHERLESRQKVLPNEISNAFSRLKQAESNKLKAEQAADRADTDYIQARGYHERLVKESQEGKVALAELEVELAKT